MLLSGGTEAAYSCDIFTLRPRDTLCHDLEATIIWIIDVRNSGFYYMVFFWLLIVPLRLPSADSTALTSINIKYLTLASRMIV
jgi:hypothetical protein